ncbi:type I polyketide synthase [Rhizomonospora bruguierae]|uniref:type I polyketide synthase n=1 Tax=Rhizomonospora bruguierae TaxID=1581705 RepID=UPI001BCA7169|nr:type I polyketide synthase [Micromonospora sp. NBRC 107566]
MTRIAVVGMACRYPDATSPRELWENALAGRRAFRRLPDVRMRLADYWDADPKAPDRFYARNAAVIEGYEFDRIAYKVAGSTYRSTDLTHWLALDVAALALADAGFPMAEGLPRERTGVVVGNTLTGEFSRANQLRLRWPYVRRMVAGALHEQDWDDDQIGSFLDRFEATFKGPFPPVDEDTLAGGLSNTIAGRICNHFDLKGGGYTVDGACSSSLLSVATACKALVDGELDVAVAGGVDLSIDPFEIIGFAKTGALATGEMRVYDRGSNGFWPGEGCGMVVLMREPEAARAGHRIYASVAGWGISSDGKGGITRPEVGGYRLALRRAYQRAGFGVETVAMFEGHGTGTKVGDTTELTALSAARRAADPSAPPAAIGSVKAMIGHTKAAAGVAGLIKASMAVYEEVIPPSLGCHDPHELLREKAAALRVLRRAEPWPEAGEVRAGVTAMGFGGINTHLALESPRPRRHPRFRARTRALASSIQDAELLLVEAAAPGELRERLEQLAGFVSTVAYAELADLAAGLHSELRDLPWRAAVVATSPDDAERLFRRLCTALDAGESSLFAADGRCLLGHVSGPGRIGFLFPGQGSGRGVSGGALRRRFAEAEEMYASAALPDGDDMVATQVAQPRIVTGSLAGLRVLSALGVEATVAVGHSLGELTALHWAGALDAEDLLRIAGTRGRIMSQQSASGTMAGIGAAPEVVERFTTGLPVVIAGLNGPAQTVVAGPVDAVERVCRTAAEAGVTGTRLRVSHAFHSPLVAGAADVFGDAVLGEPFGRVRRRVVSTVTGEGLAPDADLPALLRRQITAPVLFAPAVSIAAKDVDLLVEVGPGRVLSGLAEMVTDVPTVALDTDDESLTGLLRVVGAAYVRGASHVDAALFHGRLIRPLLPGAEFTFFESPCEQAPLVSTARAGGAPARPAEPVPAAVPAAAVATAGKSTAELLRGLAAERAELPVDLVTDSSRLLDDLHLSSITVGRVVNEVAQALDIPAMRVPTNFATATVGELADVLDHLASTVRSADRSGASLVAGAGDWARPWAVSLDPVPLPPSATRDGNGAWQVYADQGHPLARPLRAALEAAGVGGGVLVCLPPDCPAEQLELALAGAKRVLAGSAGDRFVLVEHGRGAAGLAKTLHLEAPQVRTTVVHTLPSVAAVDRIVAEVAGTTGFSEAYHDLDGTRRVPTLRAMPIEPAEPVAPLGGADVLLVTGGGKGITAECALALAVDTGARLALIGRSDPGEDAELAANLARIAQSGVAVEYARADVTDAEQVRRAVRALEGSLGPVTAVLHGAGRNEPAALGGLDLDAFRRIIAPKVDGLRAVLAAVDTGRLRLLVTLGSIIGRSGLRGEAHYAVANDWLNDLTVEFGSGHAQCRAVCLEWSVWSGVGMGERLSVVESLAREGVTAITADQGVRILRRVLSDPDCPPTVVISGRTEGIHTVRHERPELPLHRFLERPLVWYPGVELVTEVELSAATDPYLADHHLDGNLLLPAVFGMEAMAQVAGALTGEPRPSVIERVEFARPIVVPPDGSRRIRVAALVTGPDTVDVVIHAEETGFAAQHFRATLWYGAGPAPAGPPEQVAAGMPTVQLDPAADLYGSVLFQGDRFQRLRRYHRAAAREVDAELAADDSVRWFADHLPATLLLGDPGVRDALMHGNQVCVPHATLLPAGIDRLYPAGPELSAATGLRYCATERGRDGDTYTYDIALRTPDGQIVERWEGLRLRAVRKTGGQGPWVAALLGPYLERAVGDLLGARVAVAVEPDAPLTGGDPPARRARTALAAARVFGRPVDIRYRPDGRPEVAGDHTVSAAHGAGVTVCVAAHDTVACDVEPVVHRPEKAWRDLLGVHAAGTAVLETDAGDDADAAATRIWSALECLRKAGCSPGAPLALLSASPDGWTVFGSGDLRVAVLVTTLHGVAGPVAFAVLSGGR